MRAGFTERSAQGQLCGLWNSKLVHALCKKARIAIDRPMRLAGTPAITWQRLQKNIALQLRKLTQ